MNRSEPIVKWKEVIDKLIRSFGYWCVPIECEIKWIEDKVSMNEDCVVLGNSFQRYYVTGNHLLFNMPIDTRQ